MGSRAEARRGLPLLLLVMALLIGALFAAGLVAAQANSVGAPNSHDGTFAPMATPPGCVTGWRIVDSPSPDPQRSELYKADGASDTDVWAVGRSDFTALIEHWDGISWSVVPTPTFTYEQSALHDIAALSASDAWAVGYSEITSNNYVAAILHWDGAVWSSIPTPEALQGYRSRLSGVAGVSASDVWAVGWWNNGPSQFQALTLHWDGASWSVVSNPVNTASALNSVTAIASNDVWAVGGAGSSLLMHWDGVQWSVAPTSATADMYEVSAAASNDVWAVGFETSFNEDIAYVLHWNGTSWSEANNQPYMQFLSVEAIAANDVWVVGKGGGSARSMNWDGAQWHSIYLPIPYNAGNLLGLASSSSNDAWAVGNGTTGSSFRTLTLHYTAACPAITPTPTGCNAGWNALDSPNGDSLGNTLRGVTVVSASDVWAVGSYGPDYTPMSVHWDGYAWSIVPMPSPSGGAILRAVSAVASNDVWAVGEIPLGNNQTVTMHWNGNAWSIVPSPNVGAESDLLTGVAAISATDVWAVGSVSASYPLALHWNGSAWSIAPTPPVGKLSAVSASSTDDVWAVGKGPNNGALTLHWNGIAWSNVPCPYISGLDLSGVDVISTNNVWAVGYTSSAPVALHWDGSSWTVTVLPPGINGELYSISAASTDDVWAVGNAYNAPSIQTLTMHWDGIQWSRAPSPNVDARFNNLYGVAAASPNEVWAVGDQGDLNTGGVFTLVERYIGSCASSTPTPTSTYSPTNVATSTATLQITLTATHIATQTTSTSTPTTQPITSTIIPTSQLTATATSTHPSTFTVTSTSVTTATATQSVEATATSTSTLTPTTESTTTPLPTSCAITFSDVSTDNTFYSYIRCLACRGLVSGYADGTFRPYSEVTRGQLSKIVANAAGLSASPTGQTFEDVPANHTFYVYIERMASAGIISGYPCGTIPEEQCIAPGNRPYFRPGANATRGQIAKIISNTAGYNDTPNAQTFQDVAPDSAFYVWVERLASRGIMSGYPCGGEGEPCGPENKPYFRAYVNATRGQVSKIVANTFLPGCQTPQR